MLKAAAISDVYSHMHHGLNESSCVPCAADCVAGWKTNERVKTAFGSTWAYNGWNRPAAWHSADQCDLCYDGATLAIFRTQAEKTAMVDQWALTLYNDVFWFGYSIEPGGCLLVLRSEPCPCASGECPGARGPNHGSQAPSTLPLPAEPPGVSATVTTNSLGGSCSRYAPLVNGVPDCGDWNTGVNYTVANLQPWQRYYNWHDGMTSTWSFNFKNQPRGYEAWGGGQPDYWGAQEYQASMLTNGLFNDISGGTGYGYMCRTWSECWVALDYPGIQRQQNVFHPD